MKLHHKRGFGVWAQLIIALLVILIPVIIFPVCSSMVETASGAAVPMRCHYLKMTAVTVGIMLIVIALVRLFSESGATELGLKVLQFVGGITVILLPNVLIGACKSSTMACKIGTTPGLYVIGIIGTFIAGIDIIYGLLKKRK